MTDEQTEILANLRLELEQVMENLRHYNVIHFAIITILIPITTIGFTIEVEGNETMVICAGVFSVLIWAFFIFITIKYINDEVKETRDYGLQLCREIRRKTNRNNENQMKLMEIIEPPKINYSFFQFIFGASITLAWIIYFFVKGTSSASVN